MTEEKTYICDLTNKSTTDRGEVVPFDVVIPTKDGFNKVGAGHIHIDVIPDEISDEFTEFQSMSEINVLVSGTVSRHGGHSSAIGGLMGIVLIDTIQRQSKVNSYTMWELSDHEEFLQLLNEFINGHFVHRGDVEEVKSESYFHSI